MLSRSAQCKAKTQYAALEILRDNGGDLPSREVLEEVEKRVELTPWELERYETTGYVRWTSLLHFTSVQAVKAGFLVKKKGVWYLTEEGEEALSLGREGLQAAQSAGYQKWKREQPAGESAGNDPDEATSGANEESADEGLLTLEHIEETARASLRKHALAKNPYEFQDLVAALLRGMGYYTPFVAPRGKDGGIDIVAYRDPLGTQAPRMKVQVKHRGNTKASVKEVRELMGILQKGGDIGIFVSTAGFTPDAKVSARESSVHVELIDLARLLTLWEEFYERLDDTDKAELPLQTVYILQPDE